MTRTGYIWGELGVFLLWWHRTELMTKNPLVVFPETSSEHPAENAVPAVDAAVRQQVEAARDEPVPQRLHDLAAELGEALDLRRQNLAKRDKTSG
jgi:hypothetical protein